jgi:hypothetical protein
MSNVSAADVYLNGPEIRIGKTILDDATSRAGSACRTRADRLRVRCSISFDITPAISSLRSNPHRDHRQGLLPNHR